MHPGFCFQRNGITILSIGPGEGQAKQKDMKHPGDTQGSAPTGENGQGIVGGAAGNREGMHGLPGGGLGVLLLGAAG